MKKIFSAIEERMSQLLCPHDLKFVKWVGSIISVLTDPWSSETGWKDYRYQELRCEKCGKIKKKKVLVGGASYGGYPWKSFKDAYPA